jgi:hypothetical protein
MKTRKIKIKLNRKGPEGPRAVTEQITGRASKEHKITDQPLDVSFRTWSARTVDDEPDKSLPVELRLLEKGRLSSIGCRGRAMMPARVPC